MKQLTRNGLLAVGVCATALVLLGRPGVAQEEAKPASDEAVAPPEEAAAPPAPPKREEPWDPEIVELFSTLPIQERGRIKPIDTFAGFMLLKLNGKRSLETPTGEKLKPVPWLLDCMFFPEQAKDYEHFVVQHSEVVTQLGIKQKAKRDNYSYNHLEEGLEKLDELRRKFLTKDPKERTPVESQTLELYEKVREFKAIVEYLNFARKVDYADLKCVPAFFGDKPLTEVLVHESLPRTTASLRGGKESAEKIPLLFDFLISLRGDVLFMARASQPRTDLRHQSVLALFPPPVALDEDVDETKPWLSVFDVFKLQLDRVVPPVRLTTRDQQMLQQNRLSKDQVIAKYVRQLKKDGEPEVGPQGDMTQVLEWIGHLEAMEHNKTDPAAFKEHLQKLHGATVEQAEARDEYGTIPLEVTFYKVDFFWRALYSFVGAFLFLCFSWFLPHALPTEASPRYKAAYYGIKGGLYGCLGLGTVLLVVGIVIRCVIRARPPVTTLYETILFITATAVVLALVIEWINRQNIAMGAAVALGVLGMFLANRYEFKEAVQAGDTMGAMQAVLDTNFWLSTHVTTITLGYMGGLLASALAHVWVVGKLLGYRRDDKLFYRNIVRMVYGTLCFSLLCSVVGTILGGIWANYSWGRFWGWDPKENGALMICLWQLAILHARMGGYIRDHGMCIASILGGIVIAFSWWGVNLLGVGLHSYGFTDGVRLVLNLFYGMESLLCGISLIWHLALTAAAATPAKGA